MWFNIHIHQHFLLGEKESEVKRVKGSQRCLGKEQGRGSFDLPLTFSSDAFTLDSAQVIGRFWDIPTLKTIKKKLNKTNKRLRHQVKVERHLWALNLTWNIPYEVRWGAGRREKWKIVFDYFFLITKYVQCRKPEKYRKVQKVIGKQKKQHLCSRPPVI